MGPRARCSFRRPSRSPLNSIPGRRTAPVMRITVNGVAQELAEPMTLDDLLTRLALPVERVAVEHNGVVVRRADRATRAVADGDVLEIVTLVGGG